jgi:hypothetical protein
LFVQVGEFEHILQMSDSAAILPWFMWNVVPTSQFAICSHFVLASFHFFSLDWMGSEQIMLLTLYSTQFGQFVQFMMRSNEKNILLVRLFNPLRRWRDIYVGVKGWKIIII